MSTKQFGLSLLNSKRSLLRTQRSKKQDSSNSNLVFQDDLQQQKTKIQQSDAQDDAILNLKQKLLIQCVIQHKSIIIWLFLLNQSISTQNSDAIKRIYLCSQNYKQKNIILPYFRFVTECKKFVKTMLRSLSNPRFKIIVDFYNAADTIQEFKSNPQVVEIHIYNDRHQAGLDEILPLKKKTTKIAGVYNSVSSLVMKAQKQTDYQRYLIQKRSKQQKQVIEVVYPNKFPVFDFIPYQRRQNNQNYIDTIIQSIGMAVQQKKNCHEIYFQRLKTQFRKQNMYIQQIQKLEQQNHISPIITQRRAFEILDIYLGLSSKIYFDRQQDERPDFIYDYISSSIKSRIDTKLQPLSLGIYQLFHSIKQLSMHQPLKITQSLQQNYKTVSSNNPKLVVLNVDNAQRKSTTKSSSTKSTCYYKCFVFPTQLIQQVIGKYIEFQQFVEFYTTLQKAQEIFNEEHMLHCSNSSNDNQNQDTPKYFQWIRNKIILKIEINNQKMQNKNFVVNYGLLNLNQVCQKQNIKTSSRWKNTVLLNIMSVLKIQKWEIVQLSASKLKVPSLKLKHSTLNEIFSSDPNYLSVSDFNTFNFYKRTKIFRALNGQYRQVAKKINQVKRTDTIKIEKKDTLRQTINEPVQQPLKQSLKQPIKQPIQSSSIEEPIIKQLFQSIPTNKLPIKSKNTKQFWLSNILQIVQNHSTIKHLPVQQVSIKALKSHITQLKDSYLQVGSKYQSTKKRLSRIDQQQRHDHNQNYKILLQTYYQLEQQLYQLKLQSQDYHSCGYHIQNMQLLLSKYPVLKKGSKYVQQMKLRQSKLKQRKIQISYHKGLIKQSIKQIDQSFLFPLNYLIQLQQLSQQSCCSMRYLKHYVCGCTEEKYEQQRGQFENLYMQLQRITQGTSQQLIQVLLDSLSIIVDVLSIHDKINKFISNPLSHNNKHLSITKICNKIQLLLISKLQIITKSCNMALVSRYNRIIGCFSSKIEDNIQYYNRAIQLLQQSQPFNYLSAVYYQQIGNKLKNYIQSSSSKQNTLLLRISSQGLAQHTLLTNKCLYFYQMSISIFQCHKKCQIHIIRIINHIVQILSITKQFTLAIQFVKDKLIQFMSSQLLAQQIGRSQISKLYYLLSIIEQQIGNITKSHYYICKSLKQLQKSIMKQTVSTYKVIFTLCPEHFQYKLQQLTISIHRNKSLQLIHNTIIWLTKVYRENYLVIDRRQQFMQVVNKINLVQATYYNHILSQKKYYKYMMKAIISVQGLIQEDVKCDDKWNKSDLLLIVYQRYCELMINSTTEGKQIMEALMNKVELIAQKINKLNKLNKAIYSTPANKVQNSSHNNLAFMNNSSIVLNNSKSIQKFNLLQRSNLTSSIKGNQLKQISHTQSSNTQLFLWQYFQCKGVYQHLVDNSEQSLIYLRQSIRLLKMLHFINPQHRIKLTQYTNGKENSTTISNKHTINNNNTKTKNSFKQQQKQSKLDLSTTVINKKRITNTSIETNIYDIHLTKIRYKYISIAIGLIIKNNQQGVKKQQQQLSDKLLSANELEQFNQIAMQLISQIKGSVYKQMTQNDANKSQMQKGGIEMMNIKSSQNQLYQIGVGLIERIDQMRVELGTQLMEYNKKNKNKNSSSNNNRDDKNSINPKRKYQKITKDQFIELLDTSMQVCQQIVSLLISKNKNTSSPISMIQLNQSNKQNQTNQLLYQFITKQHNQQAISSRIQQLNNLYEIYKRDEQI